MKNILTIMKKELTRFFTDKRLVFSSILLPGLLIFVLYSIMGNAIQQQFTASSDYEYKIYTVYEPEEFNVFSEEETAKIKINKKNISIEEIEKTKRDIQNKEADLLIIYDENFMSSISESTTPKIEIYYNSTSAESSSIYSYYCSAFDLYEDTLANLFDINKDIESDLASDEEKSISFMTTMLPFLIIILLFSGCMAIAPESISGEKERGTISTLLITPLKRRELALGKVSSISIISICSALSSFIGIVLSLPKLMGESSNISIAIYGFKEYLLILLILVTTVLILVGVLSVISAQAKSIKEAGMYATPIMIVVMLIGILTMFNSQTITNNVLYLIPIYNSTQALYSVFSLDINVAGIIITVISNFVYSGVLVFVLTKMFDSEKIMFQK